MNSSGNDNYREGLAPPKPISYPSGKLSTNMAQLMVFLNGLILTITAFATLSVFINEIVKEELQENADNIRSFVEARHNDAESKFTTLSTLLMSSKGEADQSVKTFIDESDQLSKYFSSIWFVDGKTVKTIHSDKNLNLKNTNQFAVGDKKVSHFGVSVLSNTNENLISNALVKPITIYGKTYHLVGIPSYEILFPESLQESGSNISDVKLLRAIDGSLLYAHQKEDSSNKQTNVFTYEDLDNISYEPLILEVNVSLGARETFLQKIPLLMLLFGVTLTLIGTLYVRNNQVQSRKLSVMNKELAHKNFELNQQVEERERLNKVIQRSAKEHQSIINSVNDIIFELGEDGKILFLNDAWSKVTGFELNRSIGRSLFDLIYISDQQELKTRVDDMIKYKKQSYRKFTKLRSADGRFRAIELSLSMVRKTDDKELHLVGTITDVEDRRRAQQALVEAEKKYRTIVENAPSGIYQVTPEGQFLSANPALARILGYRSTEDLLNQIENAHAEIYIEHDGRKKILQDVAMLKMPKTYEVQVKRNDDKVIWVQENIRPVFDEEGVLLYYEGTIEDINQRKDAEIALKGAKVESDLANRSKSEFLANMSHELRTPLNSIIGFSDIIHTESFGAIEQPEYKDYALNIHESGNKLLRVINEILDVSRIEVGDRTLNEGAINVSEMITSCLSLMDTKIKDAQIRIENKAHQTPFGLVGESQAIKQMVINLISNSIKFSPQNGLIMFDSELDANNNLRVSVTDTGIGMSDNELDKAMSPFGQINTEHNRQKSGTGLGLTLVKSLVELHGGELELVSQKGIGTTATLIFPEKRVTKRNKAVSEKIEQKDEKDEKGSAEIV